MEGLEKEAREVRKDLGVIRIERRRGSRARGSSDLPEA